MEVSNVVPCLPDSAPFTPEQRAYLNGFLAGIFSRTNAPALHANEEAQAGSALSPLTILYGSQTGTAEKLAKRIGKEAGKRGFAATVQDLAEYSKGQLASESRLLIVASTYGDGEPPDSASSFAQWLASDKAPLLTQTRFSICALGDSSYPKFCAFGKALDARLEALGALRIFARVDCDVEIEEPFTRWMNTALSAIASPGETIARSEPPRLSELEAEEPSTSVYNWQNPFPGTLLTNIKLNGDGSEKNTRHLEISLEGSGLTYEAGDALGVMPVNCPALVEEIIAALGFTGEELVAGLAGKECTFRDALLRHYEITRIPHTLLSVIAQQTGDELLQKVTSPNANGELTRFLWGREIIDLLIAHPNVRFAPREFVGLLKKLQPRLYSISSSPKAHSGQVHLTVGVVQYESLGRQRKGVCSTFLADRSSQTVPVFVHSNKSFKLPSDSAAPVIMIGPGTGIAPFRGFLHERRAVGAKGRHWLFFGEQRSACDYLYQEELEAMRKEGFLTRMDTAFSRDQSEKVYVQHRLREHANELFRWLEEGAYLYVCGDASRMARDVDAALHEVVQMKKGCSAEQAAEYLGAMKAQKRYQRDVY